MSPRPNGTTLVEVLVAITAIIVIAALLMPARHGHRTHCHTTTGNTHLRGIHQGMIIYAQNNKTGGSAGRFPGLDALGRRTKPRVQDRYRIMLEANLFTGAYAISPSDTGKTAWTTGPVTTNNYSFAMLQLPEKGERTVEWGETLNPEAIVLSNRNRGTAQQPRGPLTGTTKDWLDLYFFRVPIADYGPGWAGRVVYNDNHVQMQDGVIVPRTRYGSATHQQDHLFRSAAGDDACLIYSGN